jgi:hypothetical protein
MKRSGSWEAVAPEVEEGVGVVLGEEAGVDDAGDDGGPERVGPGPEGLAREGDALVGFEVDELKP